MFGFAIAAVVFELVVGQFPLYPYESGICILGCGSDLNSYDYYLYPRLFYGNPIDDIYDYITIYADGVISLDIYHHPFVFTSDEFPLSGNGTAIIAPFLADVDLSEQGSVWYSYVDEDDIIGFIQGSFPDVHINSTYYSYAFTWKDVTYFGSSSQDPLNNTFQAVIVTTYGNESIDYDYGGYGYYYQYYSVFAIFNYGKLTWTTGANEDSNGQADGLGGFQAQAGFNAGDGVRSFSLPGSRSDAVLNLRTSSNVGIPGRWIFKIDGRKIEGFTCSSEGRVGLSPSSGVMLGGTVVSITGPCFNGSNSVVCRFGAVEVSGSVKSAKLAECVTPACFGVGPVDVDISLDDGSTFKFRGKFVYLSPLAVTPAVTRVNPLDGWLNSVDINTILWSRTDFPASTSEVCVEIVGYCESKSGVPELRKLCVAGNVYVTLQSYNVTCTPSEALCKDNENCTSIGAVRLKDPTSGKQLWSDFHPLQWLCPINSEDWCESDWNELNAVSLPPINKGPCPCTLQQAWIDGGRFVPISGGNCGSDDPSKCACRGRNVTCFRTRQANETDGSCNGQECCYFKNGQLLNMRQRDSGFSYRAHQDGCSPYKSAEKVPWLSHLLLDVFPWYHCCKWSNSEATCKRYKALRPPPDCGGYVAPTPALCTGDPHILTLDGNMYTFNGHGEFLMVDVGNSSVVLQARNLPISTNDATAIKAVAACVANSDGLHVEVRAGGGLDAWVRDSEGEWSFVSFEESNEMPYNGFSITRGNNSFFDSEDSLWISYNFGLGLYFNGNTGSEGIITVASTGLQPDDADTRGLLGTWNGDRLDDFTARDGTVYHVNSTIEQIHQFGVSWEVTTSSSCFYYREGETHDQFSNPDFVPNFELPSNPAVTPEMLEEVCGDDFACQYDFLATGDSEIASMTRSSVAMAMEVMAVNAEVGDPCPSLSNPLNGMVIINSAVVGGSATYSCDAGFQIVGNAGRTCSEDSTWSGSEPSCVPVDALTCIARRPFVGIREDVSVFIYGVSGDQNSEGSLSFTRAYYTANGNGLPPSVQEDTDFGRLLKIPLPNRGRGRRFGVFACRLTTNNGDDYSVPTVVTSKRKGLVPFNERVTRTVSLEDDVTLRVTRTSGNSRRIRWMRNGRRMTQWNGLTRAAITNVTMNDEGLYEVYQRGRRVRGLQTFILLYVRACTANRYGEDCTMNCPDCRNGGMCEDTTGECTCPPGFTGSTCQQTYEVSRCSIDFGARSCRGFLFCFLGKFGCVCGPGFHGLDCKERCDKGAYGAGCTQQCNGVTCDPKTGE